MVLANYEYTRMQTCLRRLKLCFSSVGKHFSDTQQQTQYQQHSGDHCVSNPKDKMVEETKS